MQRSTGAEKILAMAQLAGGITQNEKGGITHMLAWCGNGLPQETETDLTCELGEQFFAYASAWVVICAVQLRV